MHLLLTVHFKNLHTFNIETLITGTEVINFVNTIFFCRFDLSCPILEKDTFIENVYNCIVLSN